MFDCNATADVKGFNKGSFELAEYKESFKSGLMSNWHRLQSFGRVSDLLDILVEGQGPKQVCVRSSGGGGFHGPRGLFP